MKLLLIGFAILVLTACGGTNATQRAGPSPSSGVASNQSQPCPTCTGPASVGPHKNVEVLKSGFTQGKQGTAYAALISNPNDKLFPTVSVIITFLDEGGGVLGSDNNTINILPKQTTALAGTKDVKGVVKVQVQALAVNWQVLQSPPGAFTTDKVNTKVTPNGYDEGSYIITTGTVHSTFAKDLQSVRVTSIYYGASDSVVGGNSTFIPFVPAGGDVSFETNLPDSGSAMKISRTEVYAEVTNLSLISGTD